MTRPKRQLAVGATAVVWLVAAMVAGSEAASAQPDASTPEPGAALGRFVQTFVDLAMFDGNVLVDRGGEVIYEKSFGLASYEHDLAHQSSSRFRIASVSKTLTDVALARLIQAETLDFETPISRFLPAFPSAEKITVGHLLRHQSGIPHTNRLPWGHAKTSLTLDQIVERLAALPLDFEPGSGESYSNGGYAVAAKILEVVGGASYAEVMERIVFQPLGMTDTSHIADARAVIPRMATGYEPGPHPGERRHTRFYAVETRPGGGSLYSTARDLLRLARAVFREDFVEERLRRAVLGVEEDGSFLAQGRSPGFVAKLLYEPEIDLIVVSLSNSYAVPSDWARALADFALGRELRDPWPELTPAPGPVATDDARLGLYRSSRGREIEIERSERGAMFIDLGEAESIVGLVPLSDGSFLFPIYFQRCSSEPGEAGFTCRMLSGETRYGGSYTRVPD